MLCFRGYNSLDLLDDLVHTKGWTSYTLENEFFFFFKERRNIFSLFEYVKLEEFDHLFDLDEITKENPWIVE